MVDHKINLLIEPLGRLKVSREPPCANISGKGVAQAPQPIPEKSCHCRRNDQEKEIENDCAR